MEFEGKQILKIHKLLLSDFWSRYGNHNKGVLIRKLASPKNKKVVIKSLIRMGEIKLTYNSTHDRTNFDSRKWQKQFNGFKHCFACKKPAEVRHHIIWIKNGGRNQKNNIVGLCKNCHTEVHPWLKSS